MIKVELYNASNGIVKRIINTNSTEEVSENIKVYESTEDILENFSSISSIFSDIAADLAIETGSDYDFAQLSYVLDWGDKYIPNIEEIDQKIKNLREEIKNLKELRLIISENADNV
jgi:hypothetical protein